MSMGERSEPCATAIEFEVVTLPPPDTGKRCTRCGEAKARDAFNKRVRSRDGLQPYCKACEAAYRRANRARIAEYKATWYAENAEREREHQAAWHAANPEYSAAYKAAHPEAYAAAHYRARGGSRVYAITARDLRRLRYVRQSNRCTICNETLIDANRGVHLDHVIPIARGGIHGIGNCQYLCRACNASKKDRLPIEVRLGRKIS